MTHWLNVPQDPDRAMTVTHPPGCGRCDAAWLTFAFGLETWFVHAGAHVDDGYGCAREVLAPGVYPLTAVGNDLRIPSLSEAA